MELSRRVAGCRGMLMEGALGTRLKQEYGISFHEEVVMAPLVRTEQGREALGALWSQYVEIARRHGLPFLATTPTRRANWERMERASFGPDLFRDNVGFLKALREKSPGEMYIGGLMGCRGDAYRGDQGLSAQEAQRFHSWQAAALAGSGVEFLYAGIIPTLPEALGMARAMGATGLPYLISFMIRRDGRLLDGVPMREAIAAIEEGARPRPLCYLANCVHPSLVREALSQPFNRDPLVVRRFMGLQANASPLPPEELETSEAPMTTAPDDLAREMLSLRDLCDFRIWGGCCGTDDRHMEALARGI